MELVGQNGSGDKPMPKICPLGWGLVVMDTSGIIPGGGQQPQQVAPNCAEARCAFWNDDAKACSVSVIARELQNGRDQVEDALGFLRPFAVELTEFAYRKRVPAAPASGSGTDAETTGEPG